MPAEGAPGELVRIVSERGVTYEILPDQAAVDGALVKNGLRVILRAPSRHEDGCRFSSRLACPSVFEDLTSIARAVLPSAVRGSRYDLDGFDHSLHIDPRRHFEGDVILTIHVRHRGALDEPIDECQRRCTRDIEAALSSLGATRR